MIRSIRCAPVLTVIIFAIGLSDAAFANIVYIGGALSATATGSAGTDSPPLRILGDGLIGSPSLTASVGTGTGSAQMTSRSERLATSLLVSCSGFVGISAQGSVTEIFRLNAPATLMIESFTPLPDGTNTSAHLMFGLEIGLILPRGGEPTKERALPGPQAKRKKVEPKGPLMLGRVAGLRIGVANELAAPPKSERTPREKKPKAKNDPRMVAAARELRDRYLEEFNSGRFLPPTSPKYAVSRTLPAREETPTPLVPLALPRAA